MYQDQEPDPRSETERRVDELLKQARQADKEDLAFGDSMRALAVRSEFKVFQEALNKRLQNFSDQLLAPLSRMDAVLGQEWIKGAMSGLIIARDLPAVIIAAIQEIRPASDDEDSES